MKITVIGDTHGEQNWKQILENELASSDQVVFMGDYFDSFFHNGEEICSNFKEIVAAYRENKDKITLLIGNHDFHYLDGKEQYSGYNYMMANDYYEVLFDALKKKDLVIAHQADGFLFTHAGVTKTWYAKHAAASTEPLNAEAVVSELKRIFKTDPDAYGFFKGDRSGCGDDINQSPIWVRPESLEKDMLPGFVHVVGHTNQYALDPYMYNDIIVTDSNRQKQYTILDSGNRMIKVI